MRSFLIVVFVMVLSSQTWAQPQFDKSTLPHGTTIRWKTNLGNTSITYIGKVRDYYKSEFERADSSGKIFRETLLGTKEGQLVAVKWDDFIMTFSPHDCSLTIGRCVSVHRLKNMGRRTIISNATVDNGVWTYTKHLSKETPDNLIEKGTFTVDRFGYDIDRSYSIKQGGKFEVVWGKRIDSEICPIPCG